MLKLENCSEPVWSLKLLGPALVYCWFLHLFQENESSYATPYITGPRNLLGRADCLWEVLIPSDRFRLGSFTQLKSCSACEIPGSRCFLVSFMCWPNSTWMHLSHLCRQRGFPGAAAPCCQQQERPGQQLGMGARLLQQEVTNVTCKGFFHALWVFPCSCGGAFLINPVCVWYNTKQPLQHSCCHSTVWHSRYKCPFIFTKALQAALTAKQQYVLSMHG